MSGRILAVLVLTAAAQAGTVVVPDGYATIAAALAVAQPGDTVLVKAGVYQQALTLEGKSDLVIKGVGPVWLDTNGTGMALHLIACSGVTLENLRVEGSDGPAIELDECSDVTISKCRIEPHGPDAGADSITVQGGSDILLDRCRFTKSDAGALIIVAGTQQNVTNLTVSRCVFDQPGSAAVQVSGVTGGLFERNTILHATGTAIAVSGTTSDLVFSRNKLVAPASFGLFAVDSQALVLDRNVVTQPQGPGLMVFTDPGQATLTRNRIAGGQSQSLMVLGDGATIADNRITASVGQGVSVQGDDAVIDGNRITKAQGLALGVDGDGASITGNKLVGAGTTGLHVTGKNCTLTGNSAVKAGQHGFWLQGSGHVLSKNHATHAGEQGYDLGCNASTLDANTAVGATDDGFHLSGSGNVLTHNKAKGSGNWDLYQQKPGTNTIDPNNNFGTTNQP